MTRPLIIDSFAGGGGASTGIENALGRSPDYAINHNAAALALHAANHPDTVHLDSNIWDVDPAALVAGRKVGLLWASPDCKHFSKAKGAAPRDRNVRDLAWIVVKWAEETAPDVILMENVEEFVTWGPVGEDGQPIREFAGMTFELWIKRLRRAGYKVQWRELRACDYGAPTIRKRWFLVARRDGRPIVWPRPTHGDPKAAAVKQGKRLPWRTAAECIDWSIPCPSIFDTAEQIKARHGLRAIRPLAKNTMARIARGMKRYVLDAERPFIVNLTHGARLEDTADPFRTITAARRGEKAVITPAIVRHFGASTGHDAAHPMGTVTAGGGGKTGLIAPSLTRFNGGATGSDMREPAPTVTANSYIKKPGGAAPLGLIAPVLATMRNSQKPWQGADEPTHTITAGGAGLSLIAPALVSIAHGDSGGRREYPLTDPYGVVTAGGISHAVFAPHLVSMKGTSRRDSATTVPHPTVLAGGGHSAIVAPVLTYAQQGGGNRPVEQPHHTICASKKDQNQIIAPVLVQSGYGERAGQPPRSLDIGAPLGTVVAGGIKHATAAAFLAQHNTGVTGHDARSPMSSITRTGSHQTPVAAFFAKYYGTGDGATHDTPCHTVTVKDRFAHTQAALQAPPFGPEHRERAKQVADFLRAHGAWDGGDMVTLTIDATTFVVVDIGLRMLTPRELFNAQGFPPDYVIEGVWQGDTFKPFTKNVQVSCCGNSVCPDLAEALAAANCAHLAASQSRNRQTN